MNRAILAILGLVSMSVFGVAAQPDPRPSSVLVAWAGDADRADSDFLAVIDATTGSRNYGRVITTVPVDERATNPHHTEHAFSRGHVLFASGFAANRIFRFDLSNPVAPRLTGRADETPQLAFAHSFERLPNGNVLATMQAASSRYDGQGGLAEFNDAGRVVRSVSAATASVADTSLRPYSLAIVPKKDRVITASTLMGLPAWHPARQGIPHAHAGTHVQAWRLSDLTLLETLALRAPEGSVAHNAPMEPRVLADGVTVLVSTSACGLYRIGELERPLAAELVYQFNGRGCAVPLRIGRYWVQSLRSERQVIVLDVSNPSRPIEVSRVQFVDRQGPHWLAFDEATNRVVAINDPRDEARIWMLQFDPATGGLKIDESFRDSGSQLPGISFDRAEWPHGRTGGAIPHGTLFVR